jgi:hypothetical protein
VKLRNAALILLMTTPIITSAYDLPPVNLGFTSFLDGSPPAGNGLYFTQYIQQYTADEFKDKDGHDLGLPDPDVDVTVSLTQLIYMSEYQLFGANAGIQVILPFVNPDLDYAVNGPFPEASSSGFGDILVGTFLQWPPVMGENGPKFFQRIEFQFILPTGKYSDDKEINPGSNFWSFNPYWSGTYFFSPKLTGSLRANYLWNAENNDPNQAFLGAKDTQAGQAVHANFALAYAFSPQLRAGINGYYLKQITDTEVNGHDVSGRKEQVLGLGLGAVYSFSQQDHLFFNFFDESQVENRTEGQRYNVRYVHHF